MSHGRHFKFCLFPVNHQQNPHCAHPNTNTASNCRSNFCHVKSECGVTVSGGRCAHPKTSIQQGLKRRQQKKTYKQFGGCMPRTRFHAQLVIRHIGHHIGRHIARPQNRPRRRTNGHSGLRTIKKPSVTARHLVLCKPRHLQGRASVSARRIWLAPLATVRRLSGSAGLSGGKS